MKIFVFTVIFIFSNIFSGIAFGSGGEEVCLFKQVLAPGSFPARDLSDSREIKESLHSLFDILEKKWLEFSYSKKQQSTVFEDWNLEDRKHRKNIRSLLEAVADLAMKAHRAQTRVDGSRPYFVHINELVRILVSEFNIIDPFLVLIALLHDTREDHQEFFEKTIKPDLEGLIRSDSSPVRNGLKDPLFHAIDFAVLILSREKPEDRDDLQARQRIFRLYVQKLANLKLPPALEKEVGNPQTLRRAIQLIKMADILANLNDLYHVPPDFLKKIEKKWKEYLNDFVLKINDFDQSDLELFYFLFYRKLKEYCYAEKTDLRLFAKDLHVFLKTKKEALKKAGQTKHPLVKAFEASEPRKRAPAILWPIEMWRESIQTILKIQAGFMDLLGTWFGLSSFRRAGTSS